MQPYFITLLTSTAVFGQAGIVSAQDGRKDVIVYHEKGRFAGWPANNGAWNWGDEILVAYGRAYYKENKGGHSIDPDKSTRVVLSRSTDGGETWTQEEPATLAARDEKTKPLDGGIRFNDPNFAIGPRPDHVQLRDPAK